MEKEILKDASEVRAVAERAALSVPLSQASQEAIKCIALEINACSEIGCFSKVVEIKGEAAEEWDDIVNHLIAKRYKVKVMTQEVSLIRLHLEWTGDRK